MPGDRVRVNVKGIAYGAERDGAKVTITRYTKGGGDPHPHRLATATWADGKVIDPQPADALDIDTMADLLFELSGALRAL